MGYKREDGTFDDACLDKVKPGEPIFVLRGRDLSAPELVRLWMTVNQETLADDKAGEALQCAAAMEAWARAHGGKYPD